jgi:hypothetical protein
MTTLRVNSAPLPTPDLLGSSPARFRRKWSPFRRRVSRPGTNVVTDRNSISIPRGSRAQGTRAVMQELKVRDVMSTDVSSVAPDTSIGDAGTGAYQFCAGHRRSGPTRWHR